MASSVNDIDEGRQDLVESLSGYNLDNLYNMDEAALFISCNQTLRSQQKCQTFVHIVWSSEKSIYFFIYYAYFCHFVSTNKIWQS